MDDDGERDAAPLVNDQIDANLRRVYQEIVGDDVPDRFRQLLDQLRRQDEADDGAGADAQDAGRQSDRGRA